jgi:phosphoribosylformylglycinamidine synthase
MDFLHHGVPKVAKQAVWKQPKPAALTVKAADDLTEELAEVLAHYNVCSKEWVVRQYDHEVQGGSVVKPFVGIKADGPSDAAVIRPRLDGKKGIAVANGINIRYGLIDPYWMAASCIDEAIRQVICVGARFDRIAVLDNFCWGNPDKPDRLGGLVRCAQGCYDAAVKFGVPFISGIDSLYNEYTQDGESLAIPGTILISSIAIVDDVHKAVTMDLKQPGNLIYAVGMTYDELGGSIYLDTHEQLGSDVPKVRFADACRTFEAIAGAIDKGYVVSAHDCSEGGLVTALAEMAFSGGYGVTARAKHIPYKGATRRDDVVLFSESNSRFLIEVDPKNQKKFEADMTGIACAVIGTVEESPEFVVYGLNDKICVSAYIEELKKVWQQPLSLL